MVVLVVMRVVRLMVHAVGGRAAVHATAVVAGRRRVVSSGGCGGGGPRAVGSSCKNGGKNQWGEKSAAKGSSCDKWPRRCRSRRLGLKSDEYVGGMIL